MNKYLKWFSSFGNKKLDLSLFITEQCNFRCLYCYENFKFGNMPSDLIDGVKNLILNKINTLEILNISFLGGEPLLNKAAIYEISKWASETCSKHNIKYTANIATNGFLLNEETFNELIKSNITSFQITLDGEKQMHNELRQTVNYENTFDKIYSNIIMMSKSNNNFNCNILFNITHANYNSVLSFIINYTAPFKGDKRFTFHFHPFFDMVKLNIPKNKERQMLIKSSKKEGLKYNFTSEKIHHHYCKKDNYTIRANGKIQKYPATIDDDNYGIGNLENNGTLNINHKKLKEWFSSYKEFNYLNPSTNRTSTNRQHIKVCC